MISPRTYRSLAIFASLVLVGFLTYVVVSATHYKTGSFPTVPAPSALHDDERAPAFDLERLGGGGIVAFSGRSAQPMVVNFFASWCANCVAELDAFAAVSKQAVGTRFVGVDSDDSATATVTALLRKAGIAYPIGVDRTGSIANRYLVAALPVTFFIAPNGSVRGEIFGAATVSELRTWVGRLGGSIR